MSTTINYYLNQTLEGVPQELYQTVVDSIALLGEGSFFEAVNQSFNYLEKIDTLRYAFTALMHYLIENRLGDLNRAQRLFVNTGAVADRVTFEDTEGQFHTIQLLSRSDYEALFIAALDISDKDLPLWSHTIYRVEDQFNAIAMGILEPVGLDKKSLARFRTLRGLDSQAALSLEQTTILGNTYEALDKQSQSLLDELRLLLETYRSHTQGFEHIVSLAQRTDDYYQAIVGWKQADNILMHEFSPLLTDSLDSSKYLSSFAQEGVQILQKLQSKGEIVDKKVLQLKEALLKLKQVGLDDLGSVRERKDLVFDRETVRLIKTNFNVHSSFAVNESKKSPLKIPESSSRILLGEHTPEADSPLTDEYCTLQNVSGSFEKILNIHMNIFEYDEADNPILPPTLIEPIRNYVDWADERFLLGFVSGELPKQGIKVSFSPVDMSVLRACGKYAFRQNIFDYRGNRLEGNLMADYSARIETATSVKWTGDEMKFRLITMIKEVDEASRLEAVDDYIEFIFHVANDFPAPLGMSKRKIATMLKYITIESVPKTVALLLRYVLDSEPEETKDAILKYAGHDRKAMEALVHQAVEIYSDYLTQKPAYYLLALGI